MFKRQSKITRLLWHDQQDAKAAAQAMMKMSKFYIAALQRACDGA